MRLYPRALVSFPVTLQSKELQKQGKIVNLSLDGALIQEVPEQVGIGETVFLQYFVPGIGAFEHSGRTLRQGPAGLVVSGFDLDISRKMRLWIFLGDKLKGGHECPFCGKDLPKRTGDCPCGWRIDYENPSYFEYHDQRLLLHKLQRKAENLKPQDLRRLMQFLDLEVLKVKPSEELMEFVGTSAAMREVFSQIRKIAPVDFPVLILGESGTGKELTALALHERSPRREKPLIPINCAAIPESLLETELFGYERGAFTGAYSNKAGKIEAAHEGTLFLDEIGEMPFSLQAKLLRFLEDGYIEKVGAVKRKKVNVRLIAATNGDLARSMQNGRFRSDLYYRLEACIIKLPPVRERGEDRMILAEYFLKKFCREMGAEKVFAEEAKEAIREYSWPGNVREIINKVRRAIVMSPGDEILRRDLSLEVQPLRPADAPRSLRRVAAVEKERFQEALKNSNYNISSVARFLRVTRPTVYALKKKYGL